MSHAHQETEINVISIIVPVYNAGNYIAETIRMVQEQTYQNWELILVDDCSSDQSAAIIEQCISKLSGTENAISSEQSVSAASSSSVHLGYEASKGFENSKVAEGSIRLIRKTVNEGAAKARNTGVDAAKGRYIAFLDADDLWQPEKLEKEMTFMAQMGAGFVFMSYLFGDENGIPTGKAVRVPSRLTYKEALSRTIIFTSTVLFDTEKIDRKLLHMPDIGSEDTATWWRILKAGHIAYGLDKTLVTYRRPGKSLSSNKGKAVQRMWGLYRNVAGMNPLQAAFYMPQWAFHAAMRRILPDHTSAAKQPV